MTNILISVITKTGINITKNIARGTLLLVFLSSSSLFASESGCKGPTELVKVNVKQIAKTMPTYLYTITNLHQSSIIDFTLGIGDQREIEILPDNIPISVGSPQGWEGQYVFPEESGYMHIFWLAKHPLYAIAPNASLSGFTLVLPQPMERKVPLYGPSGKLSVPTDMKKVPFDVRFKDGTCVWGRVVEE